MAINLQKGQKVSLSKESPGLSKVIVGLGWDLLNDVRTGDSLTVDGREGTVILNEKSESFVS